MGNRRMYNKRGSALVMVMVVLMVSTLLVTAAVFLTYSNTSQAKNQEDGMQAYYMARSGAETAYEVVMTKGKLSQLAGLSSSIGPDTVEFDLDDDGDTDGSATVTASSFAQDGRHRVRISSVGSMAGSTLTRSVTLEFDYENHDEILWSH